MTLLDYISSLQDQGLTQEEIFAKGQEWKKNNTQEEPVEEEVEDVEVKTNDSQTQDPSSESEDNTGSESDDGSSQQPLFSLSSTSSLSNKKGGFGTDEFAGSLNKFRQEEQQKKIDQYTSVAKPNEIITKNGYDFKYDENGIYYYKPKGSSDDKWKTYKDKNGAGNLGIAAQFGHSDFDSSASYSTRKQLKEGEEVYSSIDGQLIITEGKQYTLTPEMLELEKEFLEATSLTDNDNIDIQKDVDKWFSKKVIPQYKTEPYVDPYSKTGNVKKRKVKTGEMIPNPEWEQAQIKSKEAWDKLDPKPTDISEQQWIENNMKKTYTAELVDKKEKDKLESWIEDQDSKFNWKRALQLFGPARGAVLAGGSVVEKGDKQKAVKYIQDIRKLNLDNKEKDANNFANSAKTSIEALNNQIIILSKAKYQTEGEAKRGKALITKLTEKRDKIFGLYESKIEDLNTMMLEPEYKNLSTRLDYLERNFNPIAIFGENVKIAAVNAGKSILDLGHMVVNAPNAFGITDNPITSKVFNVFSPGASLAAKFLRSDAYTEARGNLNNIVDAYVEQTSNGIAHAQTLSDLKDGDDWGRYFSTMLGSQSINTAVMFMGGGAALPILTGQAVGSSYREMEKDNEEKAAKGQPVFSPLQMYGVAIGNGILEFGSERISLGIINRSRAAFNSMGPSVRQGFSQQVASLLTTKGATRTAKGIGYFGLDATKEGASEGFVELGGNMFDRYILGKDVNLFDGVPDATFSGAFMASGVYKAPALFANISQMVQGPDSNTKIANNRSKILELQNTLIANPNMSDANRARLNDQIVDLTRSSSNEINKTLNRFSEMDRSEIDDLSDIELQVNNKRKAIDEVNSDPNFNDKEPEINRIKNEILELEIQKNNILKPYIDADAKQSKKPKLDGSGSFTEFNIPPVELTNRIQKGADVVADQLGDVGITRFDTTEDIVGAFETLKEQGIKLDVATNDAGEILDAKDQGYGIIATLPDGTKQIIINNASSEADGTIPADNHELVHAFASKVNPDLLLKMGIDLKNKLDNDPFVKVDATTKSLLNDYATDLKDGKISEATFYEEVMAVTSDALTTGGIQITDPTKFAQTWNFLETIGWNQSFKDGDQVIDFLKGFNKDLLSGEGLSQQTLDAAQVELDTENLDEVDLGTVKKSNKKQEKVDNAAGPKDDAGNYTVTKAEWDAGKADQAIGDLFGNNTLQGLIESKIPPPSQQPPGFSKDDFVQATVTELIPHIRNFNPEVNNSLSGWINSQLSNKIGNVFKKGEAGTKDVFEADVTEAKGVVAETETEVETQAPRRKRSPKGDAIYSSVLTENLGTDVAPAIETAIQTDLKTTPVANMAGTRNIGTALGKTLGKAFGINPKVFTDKRQNIQKKDLKGLVNLKQYLNNNAQQDFKNLPDAYDSSGKSTFIPNNILNALYVKDGKGKWKLDPSKTVADYKALLGDITSDKPIYRAAEAQTIKGLAGLSFRNKMFETAFPEAADRIGKGVKFSKKKRDAILKKEGKRVLNNKNPQDVAIFQETVKNILPKFVPIANLINSNNFASRSDKFGRGHFMTGKDRVSILKDALLNQADFSRAQIDAVKVAIGSKAFFRTVNGKRVKIDYGSKKYQERVKQNYEGLEIILQGFADMVQAYPETISVVSAIFDSASGNSGHFVRQAAIPRGESNSYVENNFRGEKEHPLPQNKAGLLMMQAIQNNTVSDLMGYLKNNYFMIGLSHVENNKLSDTSGQYGEPFNFGETIPEDIDSSIDNAAKEGDMSKAKSIWGRYFNDKVNNVDGGIDPNSVTFDGKPVADVYNVGNVAKQSKKNPNIKHAQEGLISEQINNDLSSKEAAKRIKAYETTAADELTSGKVNTKTFDGKVDADMTIERQIDVLKDYDKAAELGRALDTPTKGISVFDFDDTLAKTKEKVIVNKRDGSTVEISASEFAQQAANLEADGATFDFTNFEKVADGTAKGPLADLALKRQDKFGSKDIFVLTARPQVSASAIKTFLDGIGLNLPLGNITGLADGTPGAKGRWVASKAAEGYNDFYFADDAVKNVKAVKEVLDQIDVKSDVQIAKQSKKKNFDKIFNDILESSTGIESFKEYSKAKAQTVGKKKGRFSFFTTPSAEDFLGLLYKTLGKGKVGEAQIDFYKKNLLDTYDRAELATTRAKIQAAADFKKLKGNLKTLPKSLSKEMGYGGFTHSQAARVAVWTRQGMTIPGLSKTDLKALNDFVDKNAEMNTLVDELMKIQKGKEYPAPSDSWLAGTITTDVLNGITKVNRKQYLQEWQENVDIIFSDKNMNKLEAAYGPKYVEALRDQLRRMKSGSNRPIGGSRVVNNVLDWLNNSVGAIMFLNTRSAVLQTLSAVNFIGVGNNSLINSAKAFANQKQYWKDFKTLMNSPYLVERRNGLKINVSESEIADAVAESSDKPKAALNYLLNKGFVLTRFADSFAIATGGAGFYRNQLDMYIKQGMPQDLAQKQAFEDFYAIAEKNQQSSNPSKISQQQASGAGRVILAFANTPMQYARIIKRSTQDLISGRGNWKKNVGTIAFYGVAQNLIFNAMQNALFADAFGEDEEEEKDNNKTGRIANGMADSLLAGLGIQGKAALALKNSLITLAKENDKKSPKFVKAVYDLFDFSPPLDSKFRKLRVAANTFTWDRKLMKEKGFSLDNPAYLAGAQVISGLTNLPLDRAIQKMNNIRGIMSEQSQNWQKVALALGWSTWDVGLGYYGGFDPVKPLTTEQQYDLDVSNMKKETTSKQQKQMLLDLGVSKQEIKKLRYEEDRVKKIIELQKKKKDGK